MFVPLEQFEQARIVARRTGRRGPAWRFRVVNGTFFNPDTPYEVVNALELARHRQTRVRIHYGITEAIISPEHVRGSLWLRYGGYSSPHDILVGHVEHSPWSPRQPVLVAMTDPAGPSPIMDEQIVSIWPAHPRDDSGVFYRHPGYGMLPVE